MTDLSPDSHDAFYFSRSDLTDAEKMTIFKAKIEKSLASSGNSMTLNDACDKIQAKIKLMIKKAS